MTMIYFNREEWGLPCSFLLFPYLILYGHNTDVLWSRTTWPRAATAFPKCPFEFSSNIRGLHMLEKSGSTWATRWQASSFAPSGNTGNVLAYKPLQDLSLERLSRVGGWCEDTAPRCWHHDTFSWGLSWLLSASFHHSPLWVAGDSGWAAPRNEWWVCCPVFLLRVCRVK